LLRHSVSVVTHADLELEIDCHEHPLARIMPLSESALPDTTDDWERFCDAIKASHVSLDEKHVPLDVLQKLPQILREVEHHPNCRNIAAIMCGDKIIDVVGRRTTVENPEYRLNNSYPLYAVAIDIGTTTLAACLCRPDADSDLTVSRRNPQATFGADIISRIQCIGDDHANLVRQRHLIVSAVNEMLEELAEAERISTDRIAAVVIAGNTVMQQLLLGIDPTPLGRNPFIPAVKRYPVFSATEIGLSVHRNGQVHLLPALGGFVGGDISAGILATRLMEHKDAALLIDVGTNGEMALSHQGKLYVAATAAGPAFEGTGIECGMIASAGAIHHADIEEDESRIRYSTIENAPACGICGSGLIDLVAACLDRGLISPNGRFNDTLISKRFGNDNKTSHIPIALHLFLTQKDVRQLQLAAGAVRTGVRLLLQEVDLDISAVKTLYLAGGFGYHLRPSSALRIGLLPTLPIQRIRPCGNTSLAGAKMCIADQNEWDRAQMLMHKAVHVNLAQCANFSSVFAESMMFPDKKPEHEA